MLLFSQQTVPALHALPLPRPITLMGEQLRPSRPVTLPKTMPRRPRSRPPSAEVD